MIFKILIKENKMKDIHTWSGWPGAYCLKCGIDDPLEKAIALNWCDVLTNKWDTEKHKKEVEAILSKCK